MTLPTTSSQAQQSRAKWEVADVIRNFQQAFLTKHPQPAHHLRTLDALVKCRTAALGGHIDACTNCGHLLISYNSCRNRHCPKCQYKDRVKWVQARLADLLPLPYYHIVFTLPHQLNELCRCYPTELYNLLFRSAWQTIKIFGQDPKWLGANMGMTAVLHTWGQNLQLHPHLHCLVPGGGLSRKGKWKNLPHQDKFIFPKKALAKVFRAKFVHGLQQLIRQGNITINKNQWYPLAEQLFQKSWMVYAKRPFAGPHTVIKYLGRYTHRIAISNQRILDVDKQKVFFQWKDYRDDKSKVMSLKGEEFLRRFCLHILPPGFQRLRHYGFLSNAAKTNALAAIRQQIGDVQQDQLPEEVLLQADFNPRCSDCGKDQWVRIGIIPCQRPPPNTQWPRWIALK